MSRSKFDPHNPKYIRGIYNYCDAWCEKCPFTARCLNYDMRETDFVDDFEDPLFDDGLENTVPASMSEDDPGATDWARETGFEERYRMAQTYEEAELERHPCSQMAIAYADQAGEWLQTIYTQLSASNILEEKAPDSLTESLPEEVEIIAWYHLQIYVKIRRALHGLRDDLEFDSCRNMPKDSDGSAKVALIGIENSIAAINILRHDEAADRWTLLQMARRLKRLQKQVETTFPNARRFVRPGFDDTLN